MSNATIGKKDLKLPQPAIIKRRKRKQITDENIYVGIEEPALQSRRIKITQVKKGNGKGRGRQSTRASDWPVLNEVTNHESPKIWDIFQRFQNFSQRRVLTRTASGLLEACADEVADKISQSNELAQFVRAKNKMQKNVSTNGTANVVTEPTIDHYEESPIGGDRKRRCVEIIDFEDELNASKREAQSASAFTPKCLNFDDID